MAWAMFRVAPMPAPASRYQVPLAAAGSVSAALHRPRSFLWVPLSSPRETKGLLAAAIAARALAASFWPAIPAGSSFGPTSTKSLYMTSWRATP